MRRLISVTVVGTALALVLSLNGNSLSAADKDRRYRVQAIDVVESCEALNTAVAKAKHEDDWGALYGFSLYTMGYLTGINRLAFDTYDIAGRKNVKTLMVWLKRHCAAHPDDSFDYALYQLVATIYPDRVQSAPK
jgi:hypothetical protein